MGRGETEGGPATFIPLAHPKPGAYDAPAAAVIKAGMAYLADVLWLGPASEQIRDIGPRASSLATTARCSAAPRACPRYGSTSARTGPAVAPGARRLSAPGAPLSAPTTGRQHDGLQHNHHGAPMTPAAAESPTDTT